MGSRPIGIGRRSTQVNGGSSLRLGGTEKSQTTTHNDLSSLSQCVLTKLKAWRTIEPEQLTTIVGVHRLEQCASQSRTPVEARHHGSLVLEPSNFSGSRF